MKFGEKDYEGWTPPKQWFALWPVQLDDGRWAWLEFVWKSKWRTSDALGDSGVSYSDVYEDRSMLTSAKGVD